MHDQLALSYQSDPYGGRWDLSNLAPMLKQYVQVKRQYPDFMILFQVGDFYEVFFSDAEEVSKALNIRLTSRNKNDENAVPMCGVPIHALDSYLPKLASAGYRAVLVSQVSDKPVKREITKIVTPGVRHDGEGLQEHSFNYIAAVYANHFGAGFLSYMDVGLGRLRVIDFDSPDSLVDLLKRVNPAELIVPSSVEGQRFERSARWLQACSGYSLSKRAFGKRDLKEVFKGENLSVEEVLSVGALLDYVEELTFGAKLHISSAERLPYEKNAVIDAASVQNLELFSGGKSLFEVFNKTHTSMGARFLRESLANPLTSRSEIEERLDNVGYLIQERHISEELRRAFVGVRDLERLSLRIFSGRIAPAELGNLRDSLESLTRLSDVLGETPLPEIKDTLPDILEQLSSSLVESPPGKPNEGGIFAKGYNSELDKLLSLATSATDELLKLEISLRESTGLSSLRVKYNSVAGYFIEVSKAQAGGVPEEFQRKQTLTQVERYTTPKLKEFESEVLGAKSKAIELEASLFSELKSELLPAAERINTLAKTVGLLDFLCSLSETARQNFYVRPNFSDSGELYIRGGRHPVVETMLPTGRFVSNDISLDAGNRIIVLTGPNMGGKSTYLRQIGLIQILAQVGSFVPADSATLPVVDRVFTRIGAADDLSRGESTFMVEMREASAILRRATSRSLVLIDELGRGTATKDGFALAAAILEFLHREAESFSIFATHFHDLTALAEQLDAVSCLQVGVVEQDGEICFTHEILPGFAEKSYGLEVAKLAGLPKSVITKARAYMSRNHEGEVSVPVEVEFFRESEVEKCIESLDINNLTPLEALSVLSELKNKVENR